MWLMEFYATLKLDETAFQGVINKRRIFPNQNGTFNRKADLVRDAGNIDESLMEVLTLLGTDLREQLLDTRYWGADVFEVGLSLRVPGDRSREPEMLPRVWAGLNTLRLPVRNNGSL